MYSGSDLLEQIGDTPLLQLRTLTRDLPGIEIYGKAEYFNPGGSVKDRPALNMIREGERTRRRAHFMPPALPSLRMTAMAS